MSITKDKKERILDYMLEKIELQENVIQKTEECFKISRTSIYRYLKELESDNIITKKGRGIYTIMNEKYCFNFNNEGLEEDVIYYENIEKILENFPKNVKRIWAYVFTEIFNNAIEHSESETINCIVYKNAINVTMFIIDDGIGIFKKIQEYYRYNTLEEAIDELFKGKLTTDKENHSGEGIFFSSKLMDRFLVYSDKKVFTHDNHNEIIGDINDNAKLYELFEGKGTVVFMQLENKTHKQLSEIFDMYADVDGGLTRTKIPMKNVFGNAFPVSRSQARRLCNRFDEFKEVILDFSGVDEMGQGFADELFSKYVERNPDIKITVLNENDKIAHMIAHVQKIK